MTIKEVRFNGGFPVCRTEDLKSLNHAEMLAGALDSNTGRVLSFPPGRYDVTPTEFRDPAYQYILVVKKDGTGTLEMIPRHSDSVMTNKPGSRKLKDWDRSRLQVLQKGAMPIIIAGFANRDPHYFRLFRLIFWDE